MPGLDALGAREHTADTGRLALLHNALLTGIEPRGSWPLTLRIQNRAAQIARKGRAKLRDGSRRRCLAGQAGIVFRQLRQFVRRGLVVGAVEFGAAGLALAARLQRKDHRAEYGDTDHAAETGKHLARQPRDPRRLRPQPQSCGEGVVRMGMRIAHHSLHPSVRTIRTFC